MITNMHGSARKSLLSISIVAFVAALLSFALPTTAAAQTVGTVSYQGQLKNLNGPMAGFVDLDVTYYYVETGAPALTESFVGVPLSNGLFNIELGSKVGGLPDNLDLTKPLELGIRVNGGAELSPRTHIHSVPFAMNAHSLDGILASPTPANNKIFPLPVDQNGRIGYSVLPPFSINGLPATNGNVDIAAGPNVTVSRDINNNRILISAAPGITTLNVGEGLTGGGTGSTVHVGLDAGNIPGNWIQNGTITGFQMSSGFAGDGLYIAPDGALRVGANLDQFEFANGKLQLRTDVPVVGTIGTFHNLQVESDVILNSDMDASTMILGTLYVGGGIDAGYQRIANLGEPSQDNDAATASYVDQQVILASQMGGDITGATSNAMIDPTSDGIGDRLMTAINNGSLTIDGARLGMSGDATIDDAGVVTVSHAANADLAAEVSGSFGGDVTGTQALLTVAKLQGVDVSSAAPSDGQFMTFDGASNLWKPATVVPGSGVSSVAAGTGITVDISNPAVPVVAVQSAVQSGLAGSVSIINTSGNQDEKPYTVNNPNVTASSIVIASVVYDATADKAPRYVVSVSNVIPGSFILHLQQSSGKMANNDGAIVNYAIFN